MKKLLTTIILSAVILTGCKEDWLDKKRDVKLVVPQSLRDLRLLMNDAERLRMDNINLAELSSDDYYLTEQDYTNQVPMVKNFYTWNSNIYVDNFVILDWDDAYKKILLSNIILEQIEKIAFSPSEQTEWNDVKGSAHFLRGKSMYYLAQQFCKQYVNATADTDLGLPIRRNADSSEPITRSTLRQTYDFIKQDLTQASNLLNDRPKLVTDPSKISAFAFLARLGLVMADFSSALDNSNKCLALKTDLLDFNTLNLSSGVFVMPAAVNNQEIIQSSRMSGGYSPTLYLFSRVPDELYTQYDNNDLRKTAWFINRNTGDFGTYAFKGSYFFGHPLFSGPTVAEVYFIRAECRARSGDVIGALSDINTVLLKRFKTGTFVPLTANTSSILKIVLAERRKELIRRGLRWSDLRRLNLEADQQKTIKRIVNGTEYLLPPNDPRYTLPIPNYVIAFNGIPQNQR